MIEDNWPEKTQETQEQWDVNGGHWAEHIGEGNRFQRELIMPATERLLRLAAGEAVLDVACGHGNFARRLAAMGARVVAGDFSPSLIDAAMRVNQVDGPAVEYALLDAANPAELTALGRYRFDAITCNMALMDIADIRPLFGAVPTLLRPGGRFVFSVTHPCFNNPMIRKALEQEEVDGRQVDRLTVSMSAYARSAAQASLAIRDQPRPHTMFHRPLHVLLNACFAAGLVVDGLEEPVFPDGVTGSSPLSWINYREIPPALVVRAMAR
jgi:2-polyprenyl-3-methyl-5-hydroxy-6-metoxy-1,4-benzoquinol methylase